MKKLSAIAVVTISANLLLSVAVHPAFADGSAGSICTPVYGMANSCGEHLVVDTGLETSTFINAGVLSYILGLAAFVKSKLI